MLPVVAWLAALLATGSVAAADDGTHAMVSSEQTTLSIPYCFSSVSTCFSQLPSPTPSTA